MALGKFTRKTKVYYEEIRNKQKAGKQGIYKFLFPTPDVDISAKFAIDSLIKTPEGVAFRLAGQQSAVRKYVPGDGALMEVPRSSEKTVITEKMRDSVIAGIEETESTNRNQIKLVNDIITDHSTGHLQTKNYLAMLVARTGIFKPTGLEDKDIGLYLDFSRKSAQNKTYDFTAGGADMDTAISEMYEAYTAEGGDPENTVLILGKSWMANFFTDTDIVDRMKNNNSNILVKSGMVLEEIDKTQGLFKQADYINPGSPGIFAVCSYYPEAQYTPPGGGTAVNFLPDDEAILLSTNSKRYSVLRGVDALDDSEKAVRVVGDLVFDSFTTKDPTETWMRSLSRYLFVPGNVNHIVRSSGTFSES